MTGGPMTIPGSGRKDEFVVLVTASRSWHDPLRMWRWLDSCHSYAMNNGYRRVVVMHGDADGGDQIAKLWGQITRDAEERGYPADWEGECTGRCKPDHRKRRWSGRSYCPAAGAYRNEEMCQVRPHIVGAFIHNDSPGASGCALYAESIGLKVVRHRA